MSAPQRPVHLGTLLARAVKPLLATLSLWMALALSTYWGAATMTVRDAFAISYNESAAIGVLLGLSLLSGSVQVTANLLPPFADALRRIAAVFGRPFAGVPLYTRRQVAALVRLLALGVLVFYVTASLRDSSLAARINAGLAQIPIQLPGTLVNSLVFLLFFVLQFLMLFWVLSRGGVHVYLPEEVRTGFESVWGQDHVVEKVREVVDFLRDPDAIEAVGGHIPGGVLLWGPPGTGKTLIAEAMAGETSTPFVLVEPAAFQNMFVGVGVMRVRGLYRKLRKLAETYGGVVVFFDEADVLGSRARSASDQPPVAAASIFPEPNRAVMPQTGGDLGVLNAILAAMQGVRTPRGISAKLRRGLGLPASPPPKYRILHVMATNMPSSLDPALLRPGRIDRIIKVGYPSRDGRLRTFEGYLARVPHELTTEQVETLATVTVNGTGAVIKDIVNEALIMARRAGRDAITWPDVLAARRFKQFGPPEGVEYVPFERHAVAIHESCHALLAWRRRERLSIDTVTIEKGQDFLGLVSSVPDEELYTRWQSDYRSDIAVALASLAGERIFFDGDSTSGVAGDLDQATRLASHMIARWGMGDRITAAPSLDATGTPPDHQAIREAVEELLTEIYTDVVATIRRDRHLVLSLAHALEVHRSLSGADALAVLGLRRGTLVDGSTYEQDGAAAALESYHRGMLESRRLGTEAPDPHTILAEITTFEPGDWPVAPETVETAANREPGTDTGTAADPLTGPTPEQPGDWPAPPL
jgi:ATP-dependent Zn protease